MPKPIQISIPKPCHENWENMAPIEKGRFCASCKKNVHDFTNSSDREIVAILKSEKSVCGHVRIDQLNRDLIIPTEKRNFWLAASAAIISFIGTGTNEALAQEPVKTEQHDTNSEIILEKVAIPKSNIISGTVSDNIGPLPGASVVNITTKQETYTDLEGKYTIEASEGDIIAFYYVSLNKQSVKIDNQKTTYDIILEAHKIETVMYDGYIVQKRTFFGRIFHSIGNWFRKDDY